MIELNELSVYARVLVRLTITTQSMSHGLLGIWQQTPFLVQSPSTDSMGIPLTFDDLQLPYLNTCLCLCNQLVLLLIYVIFFNQKQQDLVSVT